MREMRRGTRGTRSACRAPKLCVRLPPPPLLLLALLSVACCWMDLVGNLDVSLDGVEHIRVPGLGDLSRRQSHIHALGGNNLRHDD